MGYPTYTQDGIRPWAGIISSKPLPVTSMHRQLHLHKMSESCTTVLVFFVQRCAECCLFEKDRNIPGHPAPGQAGCSRHELLLLPALRVQMQSAPGPGHAMVTTLAGAAHTPACALMWLAARLTRSSFMTC